MTSPIILDRVVKEYPGGVRAVDGIDLRIEPGEFFALLGPSGCGKTTLLRSIAGLESLSEGTLHIGERDVTALDPGTRDVAMVFQDYALFPHMAVVDNIAYPLRIKKVRREERHQVAQQRAQRLSLAHLLDRRPGQLSGGQQQRVALARAMAARPQVLLLDEPLSNLDARLRLEARTFLKELQSELGVTTVFVTHDQAEALALADRMAIMKDGRIQQVGTPREVFRDPRTSFVAGFIGSQPMALLDGEISDRCIECFGTTIPASGLSLPGGKTLERGHPVTVGIRPEHVGFTLEDGATRPSAAPAVVIDSVVVSVENLGASALVTARHGEERLQAVVPDDQAPEPGNLGRFTLPLARVLVFDRASGNRIMGAGA